MSDLSNSIKQACARGSVALTLLACGSDPVTKNIDPAVTDAGSFDGGLAGLDASGSAFADATTATRDSSQALGSLIIVPGGSLMVDALAPQPVMFAAQLPDGASSNVPVSWEVSPRELGTIGTSTGAFAPTGAGGTLTVRAKAGSQFGEAKVTLVARAEQNGDPDYGKVPEGVGGVGGVGGEGGGGAISDAPLRAALDAPAMDDTGFTWLYPYDGTVWPRGLPAPLLQWKVDGRAIAAVKLELRVDDTFSSTLYAGPPKGVTQIERMPIPQDVWRKAQLSGRLLTVSLSYASPDGSGGYQSYKAAKSLTWTNAPTTLKGTVYYNSYGTQLATNYGGAVGGNGRFGGATLAIEGGAFDPRLVAGSTTPDASGCRVCHVVASDGSALIVQRNDGLQSSAYDLRSGSERVLPPRDDGKFGWAALWPDGTAALGASGPPGLGQGNVASLDKSLVYRTADGSLLNTSGLSEVVTQAATPAFAPDGKKVVFNLYKGPSGSGLVADGRSLVVMDVSRPDPNTFKFTNARAIHTVTVAGQLPGWPNFLPDNSGVVFELELAPGGYGEHLMTRLGARGELWWSDLEGRAHALGSANGEGFLPVGPKGHADDTALQFEPTVAPIVAGGYAWVVFTSRRLYGNVATRDPYESDPRGTDLRAGNPGGPTTKKLWVTAIDIPATPGTDPSHPAFYLPAQELYAGNSRGFWALDACKADGERCDGGDQCCNGYCSVSTEFPICGTKPPNACAAEYDACNISADCCRGGPSLTCISGRCATTIFL